MRFLSRTLHLSCAAATLLACWELRRSIVGIYPQDYEAAGGAAPGEAAAAPIKLEPLITGLQQPTDIQFPPGRSDRVVVLEKGGRARMFALEGGKSRELDPLLELSVLTRSEEGMLGMAFHPRFPEVPRVYFNVVVLRQTDGEDVTSIEEWTVSPLGDGWIGSSTRKLLEVVQPYPNHNAGQLAFGPDGYLYIGLGDGGWANDPHDHGQDPATLLGSMLRIDVDRQDPGLPYAIPQDNPFLGKPGVPPATWAIGLRNPWRYSFSPNGQLIVADVGQDTWEEVSIAVAGSNLGWRRREGRHCFPPDQVCSDPDQAGLLDPIYEYKHTVGQSITGGYVWSHPEIPTLQGRYIFGDFVSGRLWAIPLPAQPRNSDPLVEAVELGRWQILPSTFGRDAEGRVYVADFGSGTVFRISAP
jgi:glucose/arabinose dehydrogenase